MAIWPLQSVTRTAWFKGQEMLLFVTITLWKFNQTTEGTRVQHAFKRLELKARETAKVTQTLIRFVSWNENGENKRGLLVEALANGIFQFHKLKTLNTAVITFCYHCKEKMMYISVFVCYSENYQRKCWYSWRMCVTEETAVCSVRGWQWEMSA